MRTPRGLRGSAPLRSTLPRRRWVALGLVVSACLIVGGAGAISFQVMRSAETLAGIQAPAQFLGHWQQVGSETGVTPGPIPRLWSGAVGAPSRLPHGSARDRIDPATPGDLALVWLFNETAGLPTGTEIEISFTIQYLVGVTSTTASLTVYIESQRFAPTGPYTFTVYWDSGHPTGVTFLQQLEVAQLCSAVGRCP
jgi:hypothetical protein